MQSIRNLLVAFSLLFCATSCFEITEEVTLRADGSGSVILTINMSESQQNLKNYMKVGEVEGQKIPSRAEMDAKLDAMYSRLQAMSGLSKVSLKRDFERFIFVISADFNNVKILNRAIVEVTELLNESPYPSIQATHFTYTNGKLSRKVKYPVRPDLYREASLSARYVMDTARMVSIFRMPRPVTKVTNEKARLSPSKTSIMLQASLAELVKGEVVLDNAINF